jgi:hypothetical protein
VFVCVHNFLIFSQRLFSHWLRSASGTTSFSPPARLADAPAKRAVRQRQRALKTLNLIKCGTFWTKSELSLPKIRMLNFETPRRRPASSRDCQTEKFSYLFDSGFARARFLILKGKENFSVCPCLGSAGRRALIQARAWRNYILSTN